MLKIRKFLPADLNEIMEIEKVSFPNPWSEPYFKKLSEKFANGFFVAEDSKKIAGFILGHKEPNGTGTIKVLAIGPKYRQQGIGTKLVNSILRKFEKENIKAVFLRIRTKNHVAKLFYENLGFKAAGLIPKYYHNGDDGYLMEKEIGRLAPQ